jgi:CYTH domain-containing protein
MRKAFHAVQAPRGFAVTILDNEAFLTVKLDERQFVRMDHDQKIQALQYVVNLKKALEMEGAIVLVTREALT